MDVNDKKLYKGTVKKAKELLGIGHRVVQPVQRSVTQPGGFNSNLPPSFVVTKFAVSAYPGRYIMNYIVPATRQRGIVDVPQDFELNELEGTRGQELNSEFKKILTDEPWRLMRRLSCTIGADPEIFVTTSKGGVKTVVPAWTFLGSKADPDEYHSDPHRGNVYWDGFQAEFTTPGTLTCLMQFADCIRLGLQRIQKKAPEGANLDLASVVPVDPEVLENAKEEHVAFGCAPSRNVYGLKGNSQEGRVVPYRFAGGHIHFGLPDNAKGEITDRIVRNLDTVLGVSCVSMFANYDSPIRRQYYGQAGEHRLPPHGLEYRVLSNAWLAHPVITHLVFDMARAVAGLAMENLDIANFWQADEKETLEAIMNHDVALARSILNRNKAGFLALMTSAGSSYNDTKAKDIAWKTWTNGLDSLVKDPTNFKKNWSLGAGGSWPYRQDLNFATMVRHGLTEV